MDPATITAAISAATGAIGLFDKIADQIERFLTKKPAPDVPKEHRLMFERSGDSIVAKSRGNVLKTITADDLQKLPESQLRHIKVFEQAMENHYSIWESVYPKLSLEVDPIRKAQIEKQLQENIANMKNDLNGVCKFLEDCGFYLDDHYLHIKHLVNQA
jgi:hypothetical protein